MQNSQAWVCIWSKMVYLNAFAWTQLTLGSCIGLGQRVEDKASGQKGAITAWRKDAERGWGRSKADISLCWWKGWKGREMGEGAKAKKEVWYEIQAMCSAKAHIQACPQWLGWSSSYFHSSAHTLCLEVEEGKNTLFWFNYLSWASARERRGSDILVKGYYGFGASDV